MVTIVRAGTELFDIKQILHPKFGLLSIQGVWLWDRLWDRFRFLVEILLLLQQMQPLR